MRHALATGTDPVVIVSALAIKIRQLARVAASAGRKDITPAKLGMAPWQIDSARRQLRGWSDDGLADAIVAVANADAQVKGEERDAVYALERAVLTVGHARRAR